MTETWTLIYINSCIIFSATELLNYKLALKQDELDCV